MKGSRPFVFVNVAMTADGKIATANHRVSSFSSKRDRDNLFALRATADAVMSGARTVDLNPVTLGPGSGKYRRARVKRGLSEFNLRVIVSGSGSVNPESAIFKKRFSPIVVLTTRAAASRLENLSAVADEVKAFGEKEVNFGQALRWLRRRWKVRRLACEGGSEVNGAMFRAGLVDEVHVTVCPKIFGGRKAPTLAGGAGLRTIARAVRLELKSSERFGDEMFFVYRVAHR
jgi:riboflavin-specific deaminase-like protein